MNRQEVFNTIVNHARQQKCRSIEKTGFLCLYRLNRNATDKIRCFIGALIKDEHYTEYLENKTIYDPEIKNALKLSGIGISIDNYDDDDVFLIDIQRIHDDCNPDEWEINFKECAEKYSLIYSQPY